MYWTHTFFPDIGVSRAPCFCSLLNGNNIFSLQPRSSKFLPLGRDSHFSSNAFTSRSCFSLLKQVAPTAQSSASKARLLRGVVLPAEPWVSDRTPLSLPYSAVSFKELWCHHLSALPTNLTIPNANPFAWAVNELLKQGNKIIINNKREVLEPGSPEA